MATDVVVSESGLPRLWFTDFAEGDEAGFDEGLEAITDSKDEAVAIFK